MPRPTTINDPLTGQTLTFLATTADSDGEVLRAEVRLEPGGFVPRHLHPRQDERIEVISGSLAAKTGKTDTVLGPGDTLDVHRRRLRRVRNLSPGESRFILEVRPARHMEAGMRTIFFVGRALRPLARWRRRHR
jgi:quercetin dioxygenase-like cupin family protein